MPPISSRSPGTAAGIITLFPPMCAMPHGPKVIADTWTCEVSIIGSIQATIIARGERLDLDTAASSLTHDQMSRANLRKGKAAKESATLTRVDEQHGSASNAPCLSNDPPSDGEYRYWIQIV